MKELRIRDLRDQLRRSGGINTKIMQRPARSLGEPKRSTYMVAR